MSASSAREQGNAEIMRMSVKDSSPFSEPWDDVGSDEYRSHIKELEVSEALEDAIQREVHAFEAQAPKFG